jgi:hypothetical protein
MFMTAIEQRLSDYPSGTDNDIHTIQLQEVDNLKVMSDTNAEGLSKNRHLPLLKQL